MVELSGPVDVDRLRAAHTAAYTEFEQLRVTFEVTPEGPRQQVGTSAEATLPVVTVADETEADAWMRADLARPFDLTAGAPVPLRAALLALPDGRTWWYHAAHHVLLDGYGAQQLLRRIAELHDGTVGGPTSTLAEVIAEDAEATASAAADAFWEPRLATMADVVAVAGRVDAPAPEAVRRDAVLDDAQQARITAGARRLGVGWTDLVTAAVGAYLARVANLPRTRIGVPLMNRSQPGRGRLAAAGTVCTAMNVLPVSVPADLTVAEALAATAADQRAVRQHPFLRQEELLRRLRRIGDGQLFGAQLNLVPFDLELTLGEVVGLVRNVTAGPVEDMTVCLRGTPVDAVPCASSSTPTRASTVRRSSTSTSSACWPGW